MQRIICQSAAVVFSRRYPYVGRPSFWYRINRWTLAHARLYALACAVAVSLLLLARFHLRIDGFYVAPVVFLFVWWNFTRGPGRRRVERRIRLYERDHRPSGKVPFPPP